MRVLINGVIYDSTETPIVIVFDENEQNLFNNMKKFVSTPPEYTVEQREDLMNLDFKETVNKIYNEMLEKRDNENLEWLKNNL